MSSCLQLHRERDNEFSKFSTREGEAMCMNAMKPLESMKLCLNLNWLMITRRYHWNQDFELATPHGVLTS